jgi:hypothetical protein
MLSQTKDGAVMKQAVGLIWEGNATRGLGYERILWHDLTIANRKCNTACYFIFFTKYY